MHGRSYATLEEILAGGYPEPEVLDAISVVYAGVTLHVYGFLHGVTGGGNRRYRALVQRTIDSSPAPVLIEKGFSRAYRGTKAELEDWAPIPLWQTLSIPGRFMMNPPALGALIGNAIGELRAEHARFATDPRIEHLGDAPKFHLLDPFERRKICGFPDPQTYLRINLDRYFSPLAHFSCAVTIPDRNWVWMQTLEPCSSIALRSIHMLEFGAAYAKAEGRSKIALLVGETHNTDIAWLAARFESEDVSGWTERDIELITLIRARARMLGAAAATGKHFDTRRLVFEAAFGTGVASVLALAAAGIIGSTMAVKHLVASFAKPNDEQAA